VAARIGCIDRIDSGLTALRHDDVAAIAFWRDRIVRAGGIAGTREPWCESLWRRRAIQREGARETRQADFDTDGLDLTTKVLVRVGARAPPAQACEIGKSAAGVGALARRRHGLGALTSVEALPTRNDRASSAV
jgi:hypothetical protein